MIFLDRLAMRAREREVEMNPGLALNINSSNSGFTVNGKDNCKIRLLGTSLVCNLKPDDQNMIDSGVDFLTLEVSNTGLIIIDVSGSLTFNSKERRKSFSYSFLLNVWGKPDVPEKFFIDTEKCWAPKIRGRLVHISKNKYLNITIGDERFTTDPDGAQEGKRVLPLSAGNLICRWLTDENVKNEEIIQLATELEEEISLQKQLEDTRELLALTESDKEFLQNVNFEQTGKITELQRKKNLLEKILEALEGFLKDYDKFPKRGDGLKLAITYIHNFRLYGDFAKLKKYFPKDESGS